jgi:hypothetical protein
MEQHRGTSLGKKMREMNMRNKSRKRADLHENSKTHI